MRKENLSGIIMLKPKSLENSTPKLRAVKRTINSDRTMDTNIPTWQRVLKRFNAIQDPIVASVMIQAEEKQYDEQKAKLLLSFPRAMKFFHSTIEDTMKHIWKPIIQEEYGDIQRIEILFDRGNNE